MHAGGDPGCPLGRRGNGTSLPTAVADAGMKGGDAADQGGDQTRRHIVPALKAGGRHVNTPTIQTGRTASATHLSPQAKSGRSKGTSTRTLSGASKAGGASASAASPAGTRQSEQSSGRAQAWPACSQSAERSSQAQCSTARTPTVANISRARQAKSLERAATTQFRFRAVWPKSSEARPLRGAPRGQFSGVGHSSWSYPDRPTRSLVEFLVTPGQSDPAEAPFQARSRFVKHAKSVSSDFAAKKWRRGWDSNPRFEYGLHLSLFLRKLANMTFLGRP